MSDYSFSENKWKSFKEKCYSHFFLLKNDAYSFPVFYIYTNLLYSSLFDWNVIGIFIYDVFIIVLNLQVVFCQPISHIFIMSRLVTKEHSYANILKGSMTQTHNKNQKNPTHAKPVSATILPNNLDT